MKKQSNQFIVKKQFITDKAFDSLHEELMAFLGNLVGQKYLDTKVPIAACKILMAFRRFEEHRTLKAFKSELKCHLPTKIKKQCIIK